MIAVLPRDPVRLCAFALMILVAMAIGSTSSAEAGPRVLYVADGTSAGPGTLPQFKLAVPGGAPSPLDGESVVTGDNPQHQALTSDGRFAYASSTGSGRIYAYRVGRSDGVLKPLESQPSAPAGIGAHGVVVTADGRFAYMASQEDGEVWQYVIRHGAPVPMDPPSVHSGESASGVAVAPNGRSVYVTNLKGKSVSQFSINPKTGKLTPKSPATLRTPKSPSGLAVNPDGKSLYVATLTGRIAQFDIKAKGGTLRPKRPATVSTGRGASGVAITPLGTFLYTPDSLSNTISQFSIDRRSGRLTALKPTSVAAGDQPEGVAMSPDGRSVYTSAAGENVIYWHTVRRDGRLRGGARAPFATGSGPHGVVVSPDQGPIARVDVKRDGAALRARGNVRFGASASSDPDGTVARYRWRFGDGRSAVTSRPRVSHRYKRPGRYRLRLVVTDNERCSNRLLYTGQTTSCNGGPRASAKQLVRVVR